MASSGRLKNRKGYNQRTNVSIVTLPGNLGGILIPRWDYDDNGFYVQKTWADEIRGMVERLARSAGDSVNIKTVVQNIVDAAADFISSFVPINSPAVGNLNKYLLQVTKNLGAKIVSNNAMLERIATAYQRGSSNLTSELANMISSDARNQSLRKRLQTLDDKYLKASEDITRANQRAQADIDRMNTAQQVAASGRVSGLKQADELITGQQGRNAVEQLVSNFGSGEYFKEGNNNIKLSQSDPSEETQNLIKGGFGE